MRATPIRLMMGITNVLIALLLAGCTQPTGSATPDPGAALALYLGSNRDGVVSISESLASPGLESVLAERAALSVIPGAARTPADPQILTDLQKYIHTPGSTWEDMSALAQLSWLVSTAEGTSALFTPSLRAELTGTAWTVAEKVRPPSDSSRVVGAAWLVVATGSAQLPRQLPAWWPRKRQCSDVAPTPQSTPQVNLGNLILMGEMTAACTDAVQRLRAALLATQIQTGDLPFIMPVASQLGVERELDKFVTGSVASIEERLSEDPSMPVASLDAGFLLLAAKVRSEIGSLPALSARLHTSLRTLASRPTVWSTSPLGVVLSGEVGRRLNVSTAVLRAPSVGPLDPNVRNDPYVQLYLGTASSAELDRQFSELARRGNVGPLTLLHLRTGRCPALSAVEVGQLSRSLGDALADTTWSRVLSQAWLYSFSRDCLDSASSAPLAAAIDKKTSSLLEDPMKGFRGTAGEALGAVWLALEARCTANLSSKAFSEQIKELTQSTPVRFMDGNALVTGYNLQAFYASLRIPELLDGATRCDRGAWWHGASVHR
jgi:hypothetical protein